MNKNSGKRIKMSLYTVGTLFRKASLISINDSFKKIIIVKDIVTITRDDNGITTMSIYDFLLKENSLEL